MSFNVKDQLRQFLKEDIGEGDITSSLLDKKRIKARIISRENATLAGVRMAAMLFRLEGCSVRILKRDGTDTSPNQTIITISGDAAKILSCERTALNLLARMSGIATQTRQMAGKITGNAKLYSTRKTAPGLRYFDKIAVEIGGGYRHRMRLDEMVMIKDNHIAAESLESLVTKAGARYKKFQVEVENTKDAILAARGGATAIMLDNFTPSQIRKTVGELDRQGLRDGVLLEASGQIRFRNIAAFARTGVDIISVGSITSSVKGIDMSLEV